MSDNPLPCGCAGYRDLQVYFCPLHNAAPDLLAALRFYVAVCGNTASSVTQESAHQAYALASAAIKKATESPSDTLNPRR